MFRFNIISQNLNIQFLKFKFFALLFSLILIVITFSSLFLNGLNLGIDFKGGILVEFRSIENKVVNISDFRKDAKSLGLGEVSVQEFGKNTDVLLRVQKQEGGNKEQVEALNKIKNFFKDEYTIRRTEFVGPVVGEELKEAGITAVLLSLFLILIYIWFRFEWQFSIAAIFALSHDVLTTIGLFSLLNLEFNLAIVAALLTTAGYSINDTVVVFDRIREFLREHSTWDFETTVNSALNSTLSRTLNTSFTTLVVLLAMFAFGADSLRGLLFALIVGVMVGTYSSVFVATPIMKDTLKKYRD